MAEWWQNLMKSIGMPTVFIEPVVREAFKAFDKDGDETISIDELKDAMEFLELPHSEGETAAILAKFDTDSNCQLDLEEFQKLVTYFRALQAVQADAQKIVSSVNRRSKRA